MRSNVRAAGAMPVRRCSQFRTVATGTPMVLANAAYDMPSRVRID
jgi:hypothetical protein